MECSTTSIPFVPTAKPLPATEASNGLNGSTTKGLSALEADVPVFDSAVNV